MHSIPISLSLIHPRWFVDGPSFMISWHMTLSYGLNFEHMRRLAQRIQDNTLQVLKTQEDMQVHPVKFGAPKNLLAQSGDRICRGVDLLHSAAYEAIDYHKSITDAHRGEEYARDFRRVLEKPNKKWKKRELVWPSIPKTFPDDTAKQRSDLQKRREPTTCLHRSRSR